MPATPLIELDDIGLDMTGRAGKLRVLDGMSLAINEGETVAMLGPSGAGKTTAMMVMAGLEAVTSGAVRIAGENLGNLDEDALARMRQGKIGIIFQAFRLIPSMTALENVSVPMELRGGGGGGGDDVFAAAKKALADVGLAGRMDHFPDQLSGGEQQRVAIARAIITRPRIILADEPTGNLDQATGKQIIRLLLATAKKAGAALVLITHDENLAASCGRIIRVKDGKIKSDSGNKIASRKTPSRKVISKRKTRP